MTKPKNLPSGVEKLPSGSYRATVSTRGGGRARQVFATEDEAVAWRATELVLNAKRGRGARRLAPEAVGKVTVAGYWERWLATSDLDPVTTVPMYRAHWRNHIEPAIGNLPLVDINARVLNYLAIELRNRSGLAASTQARIMGIVSAMLGAAVEDDLIETNPISGVAKTRKTIKAGEIRPIEQWELEKILANSTGIMHDVWLILGQTGLRWSELAGLQVHCIDLEQRRIRVSQQLNRDGTIKPATKDREPRTVKLPPRAFDAIRPYVVDKDPSAFVFTGARGKPLRYNNVLRRVWTPMVRSLGIAERSGDPVGIHALRHYCASRMAQRRVAPIDIMNAMGHESLRTTMRYLTALDGSADRAAAAFDVD